MKNIDAKVKENIWAPKDNFKDNICRVQGATALAISGFFGYIGIKYDIDLAKIASVIFGLDGTGDLITGYHHYVAQKTIEGIKYLTNTIRK